MAKYASKKNLSISLGRKFIEFKNGIFETESTPLINKLESFPTFGKDFWRVDKVKTTTKKTTEE